MPGAILPNPPRLDDLGADLLEQEPFRLAVVLGLPFLFCAAFFLCATQGWPTAALLSAMALSFITYGSTSHDLVHGNLGLPKGLNRVLLSLNELLAIRSGHAYRAAHLHHHARYPAPDDIEGAASRMSFFRALLEGVVFQGRIHLWALQNVRTPIDRIWIRVEISICVALIVAALLIPGLAPAYSAFSAYVALLVAGSWVIPLITSWLPHTPDGDHVTRQTRLFRGKVLSLLAFDHLYHLEHHMYPKVPRSNWPRLASRLDPYFSEAGVRPCRLWF